MARTPFAKKTAGEIIIIVIVVADSVYLRRGPSRLAQQRQPFRATGNTVFAVPSIAAGGDYALHSSVTSGTNGEKGGRLSVCVCVCV